MRLGGRAQAAIEVLNDIDKRNRPVSEALKAWGLDHRFAGSGDRAAIGNIVYDALRSRRSLQWRMDSDSTRKLVLAVLLDSWGFSPESLNAAFDGDKFAPDPLTDAEIDKWASRALNDAPQAVRADLPDWLVQSFEANFADEWVEEAKAFTTRPPVDMRVNTLKASRDKVAKALSKSGAAPDPLTRHGLRVAAGEGASRQPNVQADGAFQRGQFEIQDAGSQVVADLVFARPGEQVLDLCAGAGGKTLALAAAMENKGQIHAYDANKQRLKPIYERLKRAGVRNAQVHAPDA
ncbi:MAG: RsmB/NOP family class I SAM-dependent RNA methyltransferase, partial [Pseudomonadota bacterium]